MNPFGSFSLYIVRVINSKVISYCSSSKIIGVVCLCFLLSWGYYIFNVLKPDYLVNITTGLGFFLMGYFMRNIQYRRDIFSFFIVIYLLLFLFYFTSVEMRHNLLERGNCIMWPMPCLMGIVSINNILRVTP
jgi:hypothetical protein